MSVGAGRERRVTVKMLIIVSCFVMAGSFMVIASWMQDQAFRRAARADLAAAGCCAVGGLVVAMGAQTVPAAVLVAAALLGMSSFGMVRVGLG